MFATYGYNPPVDISTELISTVPPTTASFTNQLKENFELTPPPPIEIDDALEYEVVQFEDWRRNLSFEESRATHEILVGVLT